MMYTMYDDMNILAMLSRIDERTELMKPQLEDIFDRLHKLEQKSSVCRHHDEVVRDINNLKTENKITSIIFGGIASVLVIVVGWLTKIIRFG